MFSSALIVLRESLEAALLIGIIAAATRGLPRRNRWLVFGVIAGLLGAMVVAGLMDRIASLAGGGGQELFNATVLGLAVLMLAWHNIWMASHATEMARDARQVGVDIADGRRELSAIAIVIALAVLREGAETVLFLYGIATSPETRLVDLIGGGALGFVGGCLIGFVVYAGLVRIPMRKLFAVTEALLLFLAAGLASQMARLLIQADWLPSLASPLWDSSWLLSDISTLGSLFHILVGYDARPTGMQAVFYLTTLLMIGFATRYVRHQKRS